MSTEEARPSLLSLPEEIILIILARVPRMYYPILFCVSKKLRSLLLSSELQMIRYLLGKHCFYLFLEERTSGTNHLFILNENRRLVAIPTPSLPERCCNVTMVGPEIYFLCGHEPDSMKLWILDPRSGKLREAPRRLVSSCGTSMGLVDDKLYVFGGLTIREEKIQAQFFDLKTQTWHVAPNPSVPVLKVNLCPSSSERNKIYARNPSGAVTVYDPRDGRCDFIRLGPWPDYDIYNDIWSDHACVIDNVVYMFHLDLGLIWYCSKTEEWRVVIGLDLGRYLSNFTVTEYQGKFALLWHELNQIWCAMILPYVNGVEIHARLDWCDCIHSDVNSYANSRYLIKHCLSRMD